MTPLPRHPSGASGRTSILICVALIGALVYSEWRDWSDPEVVLTRFLEAHYEGDTEEVYEHLCRADHSTETLDHFVMLRNVDDSIVVAQVMKRSSFQIDRLEVNGADAYAIVTATEPNLQIVMNRMLDDVMAGIARGQDPDELDAALESKARRLRVPMVESTRRFSLVRQDDGWRVDLRLRLRDEVGSLIMKASGRDSAGDLESARAYYQQALDLDDNRIELVDLIEGIEFRMLPAAERWRRGDEAMDALIEDMLAKRGRPFICSQ